jgi:hypothetical protein
MHGRLSRFCTLQLLAPASQRDWQSAGRVPNQGLAIDICSNGVQPTDLVLRDTQNSISLATSRSLPEPPELDGEASDRQEKANKIRGYQCPR